MNRRLAIALLILAAGCKIFDPPEPTPPPNPMPSGSDWHMPADWRPADLAPTATNTTHNELCVIWLESPVTERWRCIGSNHWETLQPAIYGQRSRARVIIGLREDGIVVWKYRPQTIEEKAHDHQ